MTKRHTHAKKTVKKKPTGKKSKKVVQKTVAKRRSGNSKKTKGTGRPTKPGSKMVAKGATIYKRGTPKPLAGNKGVRGTSKGTGNSKANTKGRKTISSKSKQSKKIVRGQHEQKISKRTIRKKDFTVQDKLSLKTTENFRHDKEGKRLKEKTISGYRKYFRIDLPKGNFEQNINTIRNGDFTFLNKGLHRNKTGKGSKEPRAVVITLETSYRGKKHYFRRISEIDFIVRKDNVKKKILEHMVDYQDDWLERQDENEDYLQESGKEFSPKNILGVNIEFIY